MNSLWINAMGAAELGPHFPQRLGIVFVMSEYVQMP